MPRDDTGKNNLNSDFSHSHKSSRVTKVRFSHINHTIAQIAAGHRNVTAPYRN